MPKNIVNLNLPSPGTLGLNTQDENTQLSNAWATKATNCVFDNTGRLASRKGWQNVNATAITNTPNIQQLHEYVDGSGNSLVIVACDNKIYKKVDTTMVDISGSITTPTANNWKFVNFNGKCIGLQNGHIPIVLSSIAGTFADIVMTGSYQPTSTSVEIMSAFGRLWVLDGTILKYTAALDETTWSGFFDLSTVWLSGMDVPVALAEFNGYLVIFGKTSIIIYNNPWSPTGGGSLDESVMTLVENLSGVGCIARDTVQHIGDDIVFLSNKGLRSLGRTIQEKSMPLRDISVQVQDSLIEDLQNESLDYVRGTYAYQDGFYLLSLPSSNKVYYFDMRNVTQAGGYRIATWDAQLHSMLALKTGELYFGLSGGYVARYHGYLDGVSSGGIGGTSYQMSYHGTWSDLGEDVSALIKLAKSFNCLVYGGRGQTMTIKWAFDYDETFHSRNKTITGTITIAEWNTFQWGLDEWGGAVLFHKLRTALSNSGRVIKMGIDITVNGSQVALQQITLQAKLGRVA